MLNNQLAVSICWRAGPFVARPAGLPHHSATLTAPHLQEVVQRNPQGRAAGPPAARRRQARHHKRGRSAALPRRRALAPRAPPALAPRALVAAHARDATLGGGAPAHRLRLHMHLCACLHVCARAATGALSRRCSSPRPPPTLRRPCSPPPPPLPYKVDTSRPSLRTNWTRLVPLRRPCSQEICAQPDSPLARLRGSAAPIVRSGTASHPASPLASSSGRAVPPARAPARAASPRRSLQPLDGT